MRWAQQKSSRGHFPVKLILKGADTHMKECRQPVYTYVQPTSVKRHRGEVTSRGVESCVRHLLGGWIPANPKVIEIVRRSVDEGAYRKDRELVITHLKSDPAFCAYIFRHLSSLRDSVGPIENPLQAVRELRIEKLEQFLSLACGALGGRVLREMGPSQMRSVRETFVTCAAAEVMSERLSFSPDIGFSAGFLQRLGSLLVAWNYPRLYAHASAMVRTHGGTISDRLATVLGISLEEIGVRCARDWKMGDDLKLSIGRPEDQRTGFISERARALSGVTEAAEALARVEEGEAYPNAQTEWDALGSRLDSRLTEGGRGGIRALVWKNLSAIRSLLPDRFASLATPPEEIVRGRPYGVRLLEANSYVQRCHPELKGLFARAYGHIKEADVSIEALNLLASEIVPAAGFIQGCAWRFFPDRNALVPLLRFGPRTIEEYEAVPVSGMRPVAEAVYSTIPQRLTGAIFGDNEVSFVAGAMGSLEQQGLLYLEQSPSASSSDPLDPLLHFKAVRRCLVDCLQLR